MDRAHLNVLGSVAPTIGMLIAIGLLGLLARLPEETPVAPAASPETLHTYQANLKVSIDPTTHWQPRAGEIKITLEEASANDATGLGDSLITVHFRWQTKSGSAQWVQAPSVRTLDIPNARKLVVAATVPEMPPAPSSAFLGLMEKEDGIRTFLTLVPVAEVWVTATKPGNPDFFIDQVLTVGITTFWVAASAAAAAILLLLAFLWLNRPVGLRASSLLLQIIETHGHRGSLSQFQIMLWTLVVGAATAYVMAVSGNLVPLTSGTLILLGISGVATLASSIAQSGAAATTRATSKKPEWRDLVVVDGEIDVTRVQMLFFTVLMAIYVCVHVIDNYEIPVIPETFLTLMGISNGVYLANKVHLTAKNRGAARVSEQ